MTSQNINKKKYKKKYIKKIISTNYINVIKIISKIISLYIMTSQNIKKIKEYIKKIISTNYINVTKIISKINIIINYHITEYQNNIKTSYQKILSM